MCIYYYCRDLKLNITSKLFILLKGNCYSEILKTIPQFGFPFTTTTK